MPANLTPQYRKAEEAYRRAQTPQEELECLQRMWVELPKHKGTDKMQADLKQKISRLKKELASGTKKSAGKATKRIPRQGAGRAVIIGGPNSGKSQLLASMTRATPVIAEYPFSTQTPLPGMMPWQDVYVQLIDTPPITRDVLDPYVHSLIRGSELVLLMLDLGSDDGGEQLMDVVNKLQETKTRLGTETMIDEEDFGVTYTKTFLLLNKMDLPDASDRLEFFDAELLSDLPFQRFKISALEKTGLEPLADAVYEAMDAVRVYTKAPGKPKPDMDKPYTLKRGSTLEDLAELIHRDFAKNLKNAKVWGSAVHDGTVVKGDYELQDLDIVELHV